jgi:hypothetical protein
MNHVSVNGILIFIQHHYKLNIHYYAPSGLGYLWLLKGGLHPPFKIYRPVGALKHFSPERVPILKRGAALRIGVKSQKALKGRN